MPTPKPKTSSLAQSLKPLTVRISELGIESREYQREKAKQAMIAKAQADLQKKRSRGTVYDSSGTN
jgi:hypothetical protein